MAYQPASNLTTTGSLAHLATVYYSRKALDQLKKMFRFHMLGEPDEISLRVGKTIQWFRYTLFGSNTTPAAEGTVGVGLPLTTTTVSASVVEYSDYLTISSLLEETAIDPIATNAAEQLAYRGGLSVDVITRVEFDSNTSVRVATLGAAATAGDFRRMVALLRGIDVLPKNDNKFLCAIHPYVLYDIQSDNTAGGFIDVMRYANPQSIVSGSPMIGEEGEVAGVRLLSTTNVRTSGTAPNVLYDTYICGKGGVGVVDLAGRGPTAVEDPTKQDFKTNVIKGGPQIADPEGKIGSAVSYRFVYVAKTLDSTNFRYRVLQADASLV